VIRSPKAVGLTAPATGNLVSVDPPLGIEGPFLGILVMAKAIADIAVLFSY
jgi:hypothetical protein